jgi:hypothetical protein
MKTTPDSEQKRYERLDRHVRTSLSVNELAHWNAIRGRDAALGRARRGPSAGDRRADAAPDEGEAMTGRRSPVDVARVKQLLAGGCTHKQVSLRLGCSKSVVSIISRGLYREGKE